MNVQRGNPPELFNSTQHGFSQVVAASGSRVICTSGQVAWDSRQKLVADDFFGQAQSALTNLRSALRSVQADLEDVVSLRIYIVDLEHAESQAITRALRLFFPEEATPAATWIGVTCLANPALKIEIEAMAITE